MNITYETNAEGETVKVTTTPSGTVIRELERPVVSPVVIKPTLTPREFLKRFTPLEYAAIKEAAAANAVLDYFWQQLILASFVDLDDPDTVSGVRTLELNGFLTTARADEILGA